MSSCEISLTEPIENTSSAVSLMKIFFVSPPDKQVQRVLRPYAQSSSVHVKVDVELPGRAGLVIFHLASY